MVELFEDQNIKSLRTATDLQVLNNYFSTTYFLPPVPCTELLT